MAKLGRKTIHITIAFAIALAAICVGIILMFSGGSPGISKESRDIFTNETALKTYIKKYGFEQTINHLNELSATLGDCHQAAHKAGRFAFQIYGNKVFQAHVSPCHSGGYHGATEAYFAKNGTDKLSEKLKTICAAAENSFFSHQCLHGVGHGLMAWTNYELPDALKDCDLLDTAVHQESCFTGVFMENIVGGLTSSSDCHKTKYLSDDPQYPCSVVNDKYKSSCYFLQTSRMVQLFGGDFAKVAEQCLEAPEAYQYSCFGSMGRDIGVYKQPDKEIAACANAPQGTNRVSCLNGAVQDAFWDPSGQDAAMQFCKLLTDKEEKDACYSTIFTRAPEVLSSSDKVKTFCAKADKAYYQQCLSFINAGI